MTGAVFELAAPLVLLEGADAQGRALLFQHPEDILIARQADEAVIVLKALEAALERGLHAAGYLSYELGLALEPRLAPLLDAKPSGGPLLWLGLFRAPLVLEAAQVDAMLAAASPPPPLGGLDPEAARSRHEDRVREALGLIGAGDLYQVNLTHPLSFTYQGDPLSLYAALRSRQAGAYSALVRTGDVDILSASPELFLEVRDGLATTRPMKGTTRRGADPVSDAAQKAALVADEKQRAENLMIVDLMRNDLSRISRAGGVDVPALFTVETYPTLHTLTSTVTGRLRDGVGAAELLQALYPCGSITGAPKIRAMQVIDALETAPRGAYTGSIGVFSPDGEVSLNVAIRTAVIDGAGRGSYAVGGGVVADSDPGAEFEETLLKARILTDLAKPYGLIETLAWRPGPGFVRLERHLDRLAASSRALGFTLDRRALTEALASLGAALGAPTRIRIELSTQGAFEITQAPLDHNPERPLRLTVARASVHAGDPFLAHKTTRREVWDEAAREATAQGFDDAVFLNQRGEVTETTRFSLFVEKDGRLATPPLSAGLLPGVLRQELLDAGRAVEAPLRLLDLQGEGGFYVGNSLRGLMKAEV